MKKLPFFVLGFWLGLGALALAENNPFEVLSVANVATLTSGTTVPTQHQAVDLQGYYASGDGGGGRVVWQAASTATAEPCVTFAVSGIATGRYVRQLPSGGALSLLQCGVKADSSTDNSTAIQAAYNAVTTYGLGEVLCPASSGTIKFGTTVVPSAGSTLRGTTNNLNLILGIPGSNGAGSCHFVFTGTTGWAFDYQSPFQSLAPCPSALAPKFYNFALEQGSNANGIRLNNSATAGFSDDCVATGGGQSVLFGAVFDGITMSSNARGTTGIQLNKAFDSTILNSGFIFLDTQIDVEGSDNVLIYNNKFQYATLRAVDLQSRGTFGNFDTLRDNTFFTVYFNASDFVRSSARSGVIDGNYFEADFTGITNVLNITCSLAQTIVNNAMELNPANVAHWLSVTGDCTGLVATNNYNGAGGVVSSSWNAGAGSHWYANSAKQKIQVWNNPDDNGQTPFITLEQTPQLTSVPAIAGSVLSSFDASSNQPLFGNFAFGITIGPSSHSGDFLFPAISAPNGQVQFTFPSPVTGAIDLWLLAYTGAGSNQVLTISDGVTTQNVTLTGGTTPTWYKAITNDTVTNPTINTFNNDTTHGQNVYITRWQAVKH